MKIIKKILLALLIIIGIVVIISLFLPSAVSVERKTSINSPVSTVFNQVNVLKNWEKWDPWHAKEPEMGGSVYSGPEAGVGAKHCWDSENPDIGKGCLSIVESNPNSSVKNLLEFDGMTPGNGGFAFEESEGVTTVSWKMNMEMGMNPIGKIFGLMMDGMIGPDFEAGLKSLKELCENMPKEEKAQVQISLTELSSQPIYSIKDSTLVDGISAKLAQLYGEIMEYIGKSGAKVTGQPLSIWHSWNPSGYSTLEAAIPVEKTGEGTNRVMAAALPEGKAVMAIQLGSYDAAEATYKAIEGYIKENSLVSTGPSWEVYVTDPGNEPDTSKWITNIYFPVQ